MSLKRHIIRDPSKRAPGNLRRPSFTSVVREGLLAMAAKAVPSSESERRAVRWIEEACDHADRFTRQEKLKALARSNRKNAA